MEGKQTVAAELKLYSVSEWQFFWMFTCFMMAEMDHQMGVGGDDTFMFTLSLKQILGYGYLYQVLSDAKSGIQQDVTIRKLL